ncbi:MAG: heme ABC transporter ATP-binding protein [Dongiaceae bacterium]
MLTVEQVQFSREGRRILSDIDLTIGARELIALVGPNGAGKTTLLQLLSGELKPDRGKVALDGRPLHEIPPVELARRRAVLPQSSHVVFGITVAELVAIGRSAVTASQGEDPVCAQVIEMMGLTAFAARDVRRLSGGEMQRVQFTRVVAQVWASPGDSTSRFLLLDEPVSNLDPAFQESVLGWARLLADRGFGLAVTLHDLNHAARLADRVVLLDQGRVAASGPPRAVLTAEVVERVYGLPMVSVPHPQTGIPVLLPAHRDNTGQPRT